MPLSPSPLPQPDATSPPSTRQIPARRIRVETLHELLLTDGELALLDVREARAFHDGHLNLAHHAPLSGLELQIVALVPRRHVTVVLYDDADEDGAAAAGAATLLHRLGYADVSRLHGGLRAWKQAGLPWIDGWNTLIKAFGDSVRTRYGTVMLPLDQVQARQRSGQAVMLVDVRPPDEFAYLSIRGARNHPGTELALRDFEPAPSEEDAGICTRGAGHDDALWAIHCFSRTRGILGATTLQLLGNRHAGFVEDGVMACSIWRVRVSCCRRPWRRSRSW